VEADGAGGYRFIFLDLIRKDQTHPLTVTRAECSTGISRLYDISGRPALEAFAEGDFSLKAPVLFAPGRNTLRAGDPIITFAGRAKAIRALPLWVSIPAGQAQVDVDTSGREVHITGAPATVHFGGLARGREYVVTINDQPQAITATGDGDIQVQTPGPDATVTLREP
jgi:hypothetical protein